MSGEVSTLAIQLLNKNYEVKCPTEQVQDLQLSAQYLSQKMSETYNRGAHKSSERVAVMVALNLAHELLQAKKQNDNYIKQMNERITELQNKINRTLEQNAAISE